MTAKLIKGTEIREEILEEIGSNYGMGLFQHNAQSIRWLTYLEKRFPKQPAEGLNLTLQVLDGILCHDGEIDEQQLKPVKVNGKNWDIHLKEYNDCFTENKIKNGCILWVGKFNFLLLIFPD